MRILLAPNSFKNCATSIEVSDILKSEINSTNIQLAPVSDGGDGFLNSIIFKLNQMSLIDYEIINYKFELNSFPILIEKNHNFLFIESAKIIGFSNSELMRLPITERSTNSIGDVLKNSELMRSYNVKKVVIGIGGTITNDFGFGMCSQFGLKLFDKENRELAPIPLNFHKIEKITLLQKEFELDLQIVLDVQIPLFGKDGTTQKFGAQKNSKKSELILIEEGLINVLRILKNVHNLDYFSSDIGAGGGLALGLSLISKVKIIPAQEFILRNLDLENEIQNSDIIITGEGSFDSKNSFQKGAGIILEAALKRNKRVILVCGKIDSNLISSLGNNVTCIELIKYFSDESESMKNFKIGLVKAAKEINELIYNLT